MPSIYNTHLPRMAFDVQMSWPCLHVCRKLMTAANAQHAQDCEQEHESEGLLMEELGRLLGEVKASSRSAGKRFILLKLCILMPTL